MTEVTGVHWGKPCDRCCEECEISGAWLLASESEPNQVREIERSTVLHSVWIITHLYFYLVLVACAVVLDVLSAVVEAVRRVSRY